MIKNCLISAYTTTLLCLASYYILETQQRSVEPTRWSTNDNKITSLIFCLSSLLILRSDKHLNYTKAIR